MNSETHLQSESLAAQAELALRAGEQAVAKQLYQAAAEAEARAVRSTSLSQPRTLGILAVSTVSLFYKAELLEEAETAAYEFLRTPTLPEFAKTELKDTLQAIWEGRSLRERGVVFSGSSIGVAIRGADIGYGRAPASLVFDRVNGIRSILYRITEWLLDKPLRTQGAPAEDIREICTPWMSEPQAGSYRFSLELASSAQLELIPTKGISPDEIVSSFLALIDNISPITVSARTSISEVIPSPEYRDAILKLLRNIVPDGRRVREIEFWGNLPQQSHALLHAGARPRIDQNLYLPSEESLAHVSGTLRAVHLDKSWLEVVPEDSTRVRCKINKNVLDDVIGPMLNRRVIARGTWNLGHTHLNLSDVELDLHAADSEIPT